MQSLHFIYFCTKEKKDCGAYTLYTYRLQQCAELQQRAESLRTWSQQTPCGSVLAAESIWVCEVWNFLCFECFLLCLKRKRCAHSMDWPGAWLQCCRRRYHADLGSPHLLLSETSVKTFFFVNCHSEVVSPEVFFDWTTPVGHQPLGLI